MKNSTETVTVFRHVRPRNEDGQLFAKGGFVLAFELNFGKNIRIAVAACRDDENFCKSIGNKTAAEALATGKSIEVEWNLYDPEASLVETARAACALVYIRTFTDQIQMPSIAIKKFCVLVCSEEIESMISYIEHKHA
jgi:hypothetical protein